MFAFHIIYTAKFVKNENPIQLTVVQLLTAAVLGFIILLVRGEGRCTCSERSCFLIGLYLGIFGTAAAFLLQTVAQKYFRKRKPGHHSLNGIILGNAFIHCSVR